MRIDWGFPPEVKISNSQIRPLIRNFQYITIVMALLALLTGIYTFIFNSQYVQLFRLILSSLTLLFAIFNSQVVYTVAAEARDTEEVHAKVTLNKKEEKE
jgi:hypothetical protein